MNLAPLGHQKSVPLEQSQSVRAAIGTLEGRLLPRRGRNPLIEVERIAESRACH